MDGGVRCWFAGRGVTCVSSTRSPLSRLLPSPHPLPRLDPIRYALPAALIWHCRATAPSSCPSAMWTSLVRYTSRCSPAAYLSSSPMLAFIMCVTSHVLLTLRVHRCTVAHTQSTMTTTTAASAGVLPSLSFGMPPIGIGTYELRGDACVTAVRAALQMGYRLIDTAAAYRNEELVGEGIASSGVPRADVFVVVKIAMKSMGADETVRQGILDSIRKLRIDYADCVLLHWPGCGGLKPQDASGHQAARARCWRILHELQALGKVRYCGVSNFLPRHFKELNCFNDCDVECTEDEVIASVAQPHTSIKDDRNEEVDGHRYGSNRISASSSPSCGAWPLSASTRLPVQPILNQIELHPLCIQHEVDMYCRSRHGMLLQQYSPLGKGDPRLLKHPRLLEVHARYFSQHSNVSPGSDTALVAPPEAVKSYSFEDMILMWGLAQGYCTLVRSHRPEHLRANLDAARDYFASVEAVAKGAGSGGADAPRRSDGTARALLTEVQLDVIQHLRAHIGVEGNEDIHLCWYSSQIA
ncbi:aldo/keto reductase, putative [Leishmania tarentolae]|uniref:Aldo/keto reductase, putative n=1 Tax=Leishmania tarentolae TaxID=5689 RepID=A0A640KIT7_LEITA|nr:aldo/keto reductase, putative [Leishmania tarentolae]